MRDEPTLQFDWVESNSEHRDLGEGAPGLELCGTIATGEGLSGSTHLANRSKLAVLRVYCGQAARPPGLGDFVRRERARVGCYHPGVCGP